MRAVGIERICLAEYESVKTIKHIAGFDWDMHGLLRLPIFTTRPYLLLLEGAHLTGPVETPGNDEAAEPLRQQWSRLRELLGTTVVEPPNHLELPGAGPGDSSPVMQAQAGRADAGLETELRCETGTFASEKMHESSSSFREAREGKPYS